MSTQNSDVMLPRNSAAVSDCFIPTGNSDHGFVVFVCVDVWILVR